MIRITENGGPERLLNGHPAAGVCLAGVVILLLSTGCGSWKIPIKPYSVAAPVAPGYFTAGVSRVDITPPPGYPLGGHSIGGKVSRGYWTRLYARAFFFRDAQGDTLALVSCDLFAIPAGLHSEVARIVASEHDVSLVPDALILAATHTHHGPGNYMTSATYNFGGPIPGFSPDLFHFLAGRIARAVKLAEQDAFRSLSEGHEIILHKGFAPDIQRNRAIDAFFLNESSGGEYQAAFKRILDKSKQAGMTCPDGTSINCPRYSAADPSLTVLEVARRGRPIGLLVFFSVHPTAMSHDSPLYSSDLTGRAMTSLERTGSLVAGFFNGAEGDISPRWKGQNRPDVILLGDKLADAVRRVLREDSGAPAQAEISVARRQFNVNPPGAETAELSPRPVFGVASMGGAEDGRTLLYTYGWHGGVRVQGGGDEKMPALDLHNKFLLKLVQHFVAAPRNFPSLLPVTVARLGSVLTIATLPVEMTTVMGEKVRSDLEPLVKTDLVLIGLANEYLSYCVSPPEYHAQNYEGSSTLFGKQEGPAISRLLTRVAREPNAPLAQQVAGAAYNGGSKIKINFGPQFFGERRDLIEEGLEPVMPDLQWRLNTSAPRFLWHEGPENDWSADKRKVAIQVKRENGWEQLQTSTEPEDDAGWNLLTVLVEGTKDARQWAAIWLPADGIANGPYRFQVEKPGGEVICSEPFRLNELHNDVVPAPAMQRSTCEER